MQTSCRSAHLLIDSPDTWLLWAQEHLVPFLTNSSVFGTRPFQKTHVANRCNFLTSFHHQVALKCHRRVKQYSRKVDKSNVLTILVPHLDYSAWHLFVRGMKQWRRPRQDKPLKLHRRWGHTSLSMEGMNEPTLDKVCLYFSTLWTLIGQTVKFQVFFFSFYGECFSHSCSP